MRDITPEGLGIAGGSRKGDQLRVNVWLGGVNVLQNLPVSDWVMNWDAGRQVQAQADFAFTDPTGTFAPWAVDDVLGVGGAQLQVVYYLAGREPVNMGWYRVTGTNPEESWRIYPNGGDTRWVSVGATIPARADDLTVIATLDEMLSPESPPRNTTVLAEVRRILDGVLPVKVANGVVNGAIPNGVIVHSEQRMTAVEDLLERIGCTHRMDGDGVLEIIPVAPSAPVWTIAGGDGGALVSVKRAQDIRDLHNGVIVRGNASDGTPIQGTAFEADGPLRWGGPAGRLPLKITDPLIDTTAKADAEAARLLSELTSGRALPLAITCLPNPALQLHDYVQVSAPTSAGHEESLNAKVQRISLRSTKGIVSPMSITASVPYLDMQAVARRLR